MPIEDDVPVVVATSVSLNSIALFSRPPAKTAVKGGSSRTCAVLSDTPRGVKSNFVSG